MHGKRCGVSARVVSYLSASPAAPGQVMYSVLLLSSWKPISCLLCSDYDCRPLIMTARLYRLIF